MFATAQQANSAVCSCAPACSQPSLPSSMPLSRAAASAGEENSNDESWAPPAQQLHFMALMSQFLTRDMPSACGDTGSSENTVWRLQGPHC